MLLCYDSPHGYVFFDCHFFLFLIQVKNVGEERKASEREKKSGGVGGGGGGQR